MTTTEPRAYCHHCGHVVPMRPHCEPSPGRRFTCPWWTCPAGHINQTNEGNRK